MFLLQIYSALTNKLLDWGDFIILNWFCLEVLPFEMLLCPGRDCRSEADHTVHNCLRAAGRTGQAGWPVAHHTVRLIVLSREACTDSPCSPQVSPQPYSLLSPRGMPPRSDGETSIWARMQINTQTSLVHCLSCSFCDTWGGKSLPEDYSKTGRERMRQEEKLYSDTQSEI